MESWKSEPGAAIVWVLDTGFELMLESSYIVFQRGIVIYPPEFLAPLTGNPIYSLPREPYQADLLPQGQDRGKVSI